MKNQIKKAFNKIKSQIVEPIKIIVKLMIIEKIALKALQGVI